MLFKTDFFALDDIYLIRVIEPEKIEYGKYPKEDKWLDSFSTHPS